MNDKKNDKEDEQEHTASDFLWAMNMMKKFPWAERSFDFATRARAHKEMSKEGESSGSSENSKSRKRGDEESEMPARDDASIDDIFEQMEVRRNRAAEINSDKNYHLMSIRPLQGEFTLDRYGQLCDAWQGYAKEAVIAEFLEKYSIQTSMRFGNKDCTEELATSTPDVYPLASLWEY